jgi:anti-sigma factor RsiW
MICRHVRSLLSDYLDGELNDDAAAQVREHLDGCPRCAERFRALRRTVRFIQAKGPVEVPAHSPERSVERFYASLMSPAEPDDLWQAFTEQARRDLARQRGNATE